jgi:hypothetical protein
MKFLVPEGSDVLLKITVVVVTSQAKLVAWVLGFV